jgi:hypothetical protein
VPFGTGPKIREIIAGREMSVYNPAIFYLIKELNDFINSAKLDDFENFPVFSSEIMEFFNENNFTESWKKILKNTPEKLDHLKAAFNTWFDAFSTLKFVHFCEDNRHWKRSKCYPLNSIVNTNSNSWNSLEKNKTTQGQNDQNFACRIMIHSMSLLI